MMIVAIMLFLGCLLSALGLRFVKLGKQSLTWIPHTATIIDSKYMVEKGDPVRPQRFNHLLVNYQYTIHGEDYVSSRIKFKWTRQNIHIEKKKYPVGKEITIYVNPEDYRQAVVEPGIDFTNFSAIFCGAFFIVASIWIFLQ